MIFREATVDDALGIARVHVDTWRNTYASFLPPEYLAAMSYKKSQRMFQSLLTRPQPGAKTFVADAGDKRGIAGASTGGYNSRGHPTYQGELVGIYVLPMYQRQGIGRHLVRAMKDHLLQHGVRGMLVWVFADNPNWSFYEHLGATFAGEQWIEIGGKKLKEIALGWKDIRVLTV